MRVLQLIDSLNAGGAERMAVNYANALATRLEGSFLCATRKEGLLKASISKDVEYLFLNRKKTIDITAIKRLSTFVKEHHIDVIHAHATSFFLATLVKILNPKLVLVWHDHYGNSEFLENRPLFVLKKCSRWFNYIITVNTNLEAWAKNNLLNTPVAYLPNFAQVTSSKQQTTLKGVKNKRIVCLANLRPQKDHLNLLKAFKKVLKKHSEWTLHLLGKDFQDDYATEIKGFISKNNLEENIFLYGSCTDVNHILRQGDIGVLASKSEGLPLALLEYGLAKLAVVATQVGDCHKVISTEDEGLLVAPKHPEALAQAIATYIENENLRVVAAENLNAKVLSEFSETGVIEVLITIYNSNKP
ncbi:glycosyltransferase [Tamlana sp. 2_MG-2023]|uniref:glycosyltransferase n=1 Tax=unclassified Tamlana TaxID=2614803 RepID=UPI0026E20507|nr:MULTISPECIES: glycosyltransferase [unclassified Tamlana]MDO6758772.1 glycosyltransferase [Tamlana sp. 2_MG-2023]MDO6789471.1 glycosyltransferase [Tamlana sp. 1_MG-2023]